MENQMSSINGQNYLSEVDDGLLMHDRGAWTAEKLSYLSRYLNMFTTSMEKSNWRELQFIDLFSGPGKIKLKKDCRIILGSPLLSIKLLHPFTKYYFSDIAPQSIDALRIRCQSSPLNKKINFFVGDSNITVKNIVKEINNIDDVYILRKMAFNELSLS